MRSRFFWSAAVAVAAIIAMGSLNTMSASAAQPGGNPATGQAKTADYRSAPADPGTVEVAAPVDYCGTPDFDVPDRGTYFDFGDSCATHDKCYSYGGSEADRAACDQAFLGNMIQSCNNLWPATSLTNLRNRQTCYRIAFVYYAGVRLGGSAYFNYGL